MRLNAVSNLGFGHRFQCGLHSACNAKTGRSTRPTLILRRLYLHISLAGVHRDNLCGIA